MYTPISSVISDRMNDIDRKHRDLMKERNKLLEQQKVGVVLITELKKVSMLIISTI